MVHAGDLGGGEKLRLYSQKPLEGCGTAVTLKVSVKVTLKESLKGVSLAAEWGPLVRVY